MSDDQDALADTSRPGPLGRALEALAAFLALCGGAVLAALMIMSVASIVGRWLYGKPVPGDFELVSLGCGIAVSAFLPYTQMHRANIIVDFFTNAVNPSGRAALDALGSLLVAVVMGLVAWRVGVGMLSVKAAGETSMIMGVPTWLGYAGMVPGFALTAVAGLYTAFTDWRRA